jgi:hypothetical protein
MHEGGFVDELAGALDQVPKHLIRPPGQRSHLARGRNEHLQNRVEAESAEFVIGLGVELIHAEPPLDGYSTFIPDYK